MSDIHILDTSAVLALLQQESGAGLVEAALDEDHCWMTAVNTCEVLSKLCERGASLEEARARLDRLVVAVQVFDAELAALAASLRVPTRSIGASLGDRACLALAQQAARTGDTPIVYTADTAWTRLKWPFKVVAIR